MGRGGAAKRISPARGSRGARSRFRSFAFSFARSLSVAFPFALSLSFLCLLRFHFRSFSLFPLPLRHATPESTLDCRCRGHGDLCPPSGPGTLRGVSHEPPTPSGLLFTEVRELAAGPRGNSCGPLRRGPRQGEGWGERTCALVEPFGFWGESWARGAVNGNESL